MKKTLIAFLLVISSIPIFAKGKEGTEKIAKGTFVKGILFNGGSVTTGSTKNYHRFWIILEGYAFGPMHRKINMDQVFVLGLASADYTDEKVYIRLQDLSYYDHNGEAVSVKVQGDVLYKGETGIPGKLIEKEAQLIFKASLIAVLDGVVRILEKTPGVFGLTESTTLNTGGQILNEAAPNAFNSIANIYVEMLSRYQPKVAIQNGIEVIVQFENEFEFYTKEFVKE